jgi:hypothetical protein
LFAPRPPVTQEEIEGRGQADAGQICNQVMKPRGIYQQLDGNHTDNQPKKAGNVVFAKGVNHRRAPSAECPDIVPGEVINNSDLDGHRRGKEQRQGRYLVQNQQGYRVYDNAGAADRAELQKTWDLGEDRSGESVRAYCEEDRSRS